MSLLYSRLALAKVLLYTMAYTGSPQGGDTSLASPQAIATWFNWQGWSALNATDRISILLTFNILLNGPPLFKYLIWVLYQMDA